MVCLKKAREVVACLNKFHLFPESCLERYSMTYSTVRGRQGGGRVEIVASFTASDIGIYPELTS